MSSDDDDLTQDEFMLRDLLEYEAEHVTSIQNILSSHPEASELWVRLVLLLKDWRGNAAIRSKRLDKITGENINADGPTVLWAKYNKHLEHGHKLDFGGRRQNTHIKEVPGSEYSLLIGYGSREGRKVKRWQCIVPGVGQYAAAPPAVGAADDDDIGWISLEKDGEQYWVDDGIAVYLIFAPPAPGAPSVKQRRSDTSNALACQASASTALHTTQNMKEAWLEAFASGTPSLQEVEDMWEQLKRRLGPKAKPSDVTDTWQRNALHIVCTEVNDWPPDRLPEQRHAVAPMDPAKRLQLINWLLQTDPTCLSKRNNNGSTPLIVACQFGSEEVVAALLGAKGFKLECLLARTKSGWNALHRASTSGHPHIVRMLLDALATKAKQYASRQRSSSKAAKAHRDASPSSPEGEAGAAVPLTAQEIVACSLYHAPTKHYSGDVLEQVCGERGWAVAAAETLQAAAMADAVMAEAAAHAAHGGAMVP